MPQPLEEMGVTEWWLLQSIFQIYGVTKWRKVFASVGVPGSLILEMMETCTSLGCRIFGGLLGQEVALGVPDSMGDFPSLSCRGHPLSSWVCLWFLLPHHPTPLCFVPSKLYSALLAKQSLKV